VPTPFLAFVAISGAFGVGSLALLARRRFALDAALGGALVASLALGYLAATRSDPPSLLPLWGWLAGLFLGAVPGLAAWLLVRARSRPPQLQDVFD